MITAVLLAALTQAGPALAGPALDGPAVRPGPGGSPDCPLFFLDFTNARDGDSKRLVGTLANAGPGRARELRVEVHAIGIEGEDMGTFSARTTPSSLAAGQAGHFEVRLPTDEWTRTTSAVRFDRSILEAHLVRCDVPASDRTDTAGRTRSYYLRLDLAAREEMEILEHELVRERTEVHSAIIRKERKAYREIPQIRERLGELRRYVDEEIPAMAKEAGAPPDWLEIERP